jgi:hypothetical protein
LPDHLNSMVERSSPELRDRWIQSGTEGQVTQAWFRTMGARLMFDGTVFQGPGEAQIDFMRLVYVSPILDPNRRLRGPSDISPAAWVWEWVAGARVERIGKPGEVLGVQMELQYVRARRGLTWNAEAKADSRGRATVRVPYATTPTNGEGRVSKASWKMGSQQGSLEISEQAVQEHLTVDLK